MSWYVVTVSRLPRVNGLTETWWKNAYYDLVGWKALNPMDKFGESVSTKGRDNLNRLDAAYRILTEQVSDRDFGAIKWQEVEALFQISNAIKGATTPMFGSKLSHFIMPGAYPIIDSYAVGYRPPFDQDYRAYWEECKTGWTECDQEDLISCLAKVINSKCQSITPDCPWVQRLRSCIK